MNIFSLLCSAGDHVLWQSGRIPHISDPGKVGRPRARFGREGGIVEVGLAWWQLPRGIYERSWWGIQISGNNNSLNYKTTQKHSSVLNAVIWIPEIISNCRFLSGWEWRDHQWGEKGQICAYRLALKSKVHHAERVLEDRQMRLHSEWRRVHGRANCTCAAFEFTISLAVQQGNHTPSSDGVDITMDKGDTHVKY